MEEEEQKTFKDLRKKLSSNLVLKFPNFIKLFEVHTDANDFTINAVFLQDGHLISFVKKKFTRHNYDGQLMKMSLCHHDIPPNSS